MYRFYAEVAGAKIREIDYRSAPLAFPLAELLDAITPATRAILISNPNNPTGTAIGFRRSSRFWKRAPHAAVLIDEAYYEFCGITALPSDREVSEPVCEPHFLQGLRDGGDAYGLPVFAGRERSVSAQGAIPV